MSLEEECRRLLDFSQERINMAVLDQVCEIGYGGTQNEQERKFAAQVLNQLKDHEGAWTRVHQILTETQMLPTKYFGLQVLEGVIAKRWKILPEEQSLGIRNFIVQMCIDGSASAETLKSNELFLSKCNLVLVAILKHDWPEKWPTFLTDLVGASKSSESLCQNNMVILRLLSEEVFDFSKGRMTQAKAKHLKDEMCKEFGSVFELCQLVLTTSESAPLVDTTLRTLLRFLSWIPTGYIFGTDLIATLVMKFLNVDMFRNITMQCLTEIAALQQPEANKHLVVMFQGVLQSVQAMLPVDTNIAAVYDKSLHAEQNFVQDLCMFLSTFLKEHSDLLESDELGPSLLIALEYLVLISHVENLEVFKSALEYWNFLAASLYHETALAQGLLGQQPNLRQQFYARVLTKVRVVMVSRMAKPEEVLIEPDNDGTGTHRVQTANTAQIEHYKVMMETLVYLTHLNYAETEKILTDGLAHQVKHFTWNGLNTLCWAIGSIYGAMHMNDEKRFLVYVIKELLGLCDQQRGKHNKAIIASNIMYIVGQYPRFLRAHWKFLRTVINKLFEFMTEVHPGVQDMACDTFLKIAKACRKLFVQVQAGEPQPFIKDILQTIPLVIRDLQPHQVHTFFEAVGYMIQAQADEQTRHTLIGLLMKLPNQQWATITQEASRVLVDEAAVHSLLNILKTNVAACKSIGAPFMDQLVCLYMDMLLMYGKLGEGISQWSSGQLRLDNTVGPMMSGVRREILRLISMWIEKATNPERVVADFIPPLMQAVLGDYQAGVPKAREPEVLNCMATVVSALKSHIAPNVLDIFAAVFTPTLDMIKDDFQDFPLIRTNFYKMLHAIVAWCFEAIARLTGEQFKLVIDAIVWGFRHPMRDVAETSLRTLRELLDHCYRAPQEFSQPFFQTYYMHIMREMFAVVTDSVHMAELNLHSIILQTMFQRIEDRAIEARLDPEGVRNNIQYVSEATAELLKGAFEHLQPKQLQLIVKGFFDHNTDPSGFKGHLRDFLVQCREVAGQDLDEFYLREHQATLREAERHKAERIGKVPGMVGYGGDDGMA